MIDDMSLLYILPVGILTIVVAIQAFVIIALVTRLSLVNRELMIIVGGRDGAGTARALVASSLPPKKHINGVSTDSKKDTTANPNRHKVVVGLRQ